MNSAMPDLANSGLMPVNQVGVLPEFIAPTFTGQPTLYVNAVQVIPNKQNIPFIVVEAPRERFLQWPGSAHFTEIGNGRYAVVATRTVSQALQQATHRRIPTMVKYGWPSLLQRTPYWHQRITAQWFVHFDRGWCLNGMRSGKTWSAIAALDHMFLTGEIKRALIAVPSTIIDDTWARELAATIPGRTLYIGNGSVDDLIRVLVDKKVEIVLINHDKLKHAETAIKEAYDPCAVVVDEGGPFRHDGSNITTALRHIVGIPYEGIPKNRETRRKFWMLSATPNPQYPTDVWAVARMIKPESVDTQFSMFSGKTIVEMMGGRKLLKDGWQRWVRKALDPCILFRTEDCIDLPEQGYVKRLVPFTGRQNKAVRELIKDGRTMVKDLDSGDESEVLLKNVIAQIVKLTQIAGGIVLDTDGRPMKVGADRRIAAVRDVMTEVLDREDSGVIIMCPFTAIQPYIQKELERLTQGRYKSIVVNGKVPTAQRKVLLKQFREDNSIKAIILHPEVGLYGLDLSRCNTTIWYLPTVRAVQFIQGNARQQAAKSERKPKTTVVMMYGCAQEERLYDRLMEQDKNQASTTEIFRIIMQR